MKRLYTLLLLTAALAARSQTEERLRITYQDGSREEMSMTDVRYFDFVNRPSAYNSCPEGTVAEAVDMGLSVRWASWNVGASKPSEFGGYFGWADPTGELTSTNSSDYRGDVTDIGGTQWDGATALWGTQWRIPTAAQWQELIDQCSWQLTEQDGETGWEVTASNGKSIFLPLTGYRYGSLYPTRTNPTEYRLADTYERYIRLSVSEYGITDFWPVIYEGMPIRAVCDAVEQPYFDISPERVMLTAEAEAMSVLTIETNSSWHLISGKPSWLTVTPDRGNASGVVTLTATANTSPEPRTATLRFGTDGAITKDVTVEQAGPLPATLFALPYMGWEASEATVRQNMSSYTLRDEGYNTSGTRYLYYNAKYREYGTIMFITDGFGLSSSRVVVRKDAATIEEIDALLREASFLLDHVNDDGSRVYGFVNLSTVSIETMVDVYESTDGASYYVDFISYKYLQPEPPAPNYFDKPYLAWGTSRSSVRSYMLNNGYKLIDESLTANNGYYLAFDGRQQEEFSAYYFDAARLLMQVSVAVETSVATRSQLGTFLTDGLNFIALGPSSDGTSDLFISDDMVTAAYVSTSVMSSGAQVNIVTFIDFNSTSSSVKGQRHGATDKRITATMVERHRPMPLPKALERRFILTGALRSTKEDAESRGVSPTDMPLPASRR